MTVAVATVAVGVAGATVIATGPRADLRPWQAASTVFTARSVSHAGLTITLRTYTPGSVSAVTVILGYAAVAVPRLRALGMWDRRS